MKKVFITTVVTTTLLLGDVGMLTKIVDGDTVHFGNIICRFAYIDTPESTNNARLNSKLEKCTGVTVETMIKAGKSAKEYTEKMLIKGKTYKYNIVSTDRYNRNVCEIYKDAELFNLKMVEEGFAVPYYQYIPSKMYYQFNKASKEAVRNKKGLYGSNPSAIQCIY